MPSKTVHPSCYLIAVASGLLVTGCSTWSAGKVTNVRPTTHEVKQVFPERVILTEGDISDRPYTVLGDISVTVNKTTIFHSDPTKEMVNESLRKEAAKFGADAVTHVRYGTVGIAMMSWGSLDGKGRAVQFKR